MTHDELLHKTAEMIAADDWNKRNTQDLFHNQSTEMQDVLRASKMDIASIMVNEFYEWYLSGVSMGQDGYGEKKAIEYGLIPEPKQDSPTEENWKL